MEFEVADEQCTDMRRKAAILQVSIRVHRSYIQLRATANLATRSSGPTSQCAATQYSAYWDLGLTWRRG